LFSESVTEATVLLFGPLVDQVVHTAIRLCWPVLFGKLTTQVVPVEPHVEFWLVVNPIIANAGKASSSTTQRAKLLTATSSFVFG